VSTFRVGVDEIALVSGGGAWLGTYGVLVRALFEDLLGDQLPVDARVETEDLAAFYVRVAGVEPDALVLADSRRLPIEEITGGVGVT